MNQKEEVSEINFLLQLISNGTTGEQSGFNFSDNIALSTIQEYINDMNTVHKPQTIILICLYIPIFLLSLIGNSVVIFVVVRNPNMRKVKNIFLVNLACADLGVTLTCMPIVAATVAFRIWIYGEFLCKFTGYIQGVAVTASIWTLATLSIDRYLAIRVPLSMRRLRRSKHAVEVMLFIWIASGLVISPMLYVRTVKNVEFEKFNIHVSYCIEQWSNISYQQSFAVFLLLLIYAIPIVVISICYILIGKTLCVTDLHRKTSDSSSTVALGRKRVARMLIALICVFLICWLPYNICSLSLDIKMDFLDTKVLPFTLLFAHTHSAINPFLYWFLNKGFRSYMKKAMRCEYIRVIRDTQSPQNGDEFDDACGANFRAAQEALAAAKQSKQTIKHKIEYSPLNTDSDEAQSAPQNGERQKKYESVRTHVYSIHDRQTSSIKRAHSAMPDICMTDDNPTTKSTHSEQEAIQQKECVVKRAHSALASIFGASSSHPSSRQLTFIKADVEPRRNGETPPTAPLLELCKTYSNGCESDSYRCDVKFIVGSSERESSLTSTFN